ncbi:helix-turn-helix domain-containing protein [Chengkuizengella axinellae]|uniref:AraC family transcriptional regulator n=1 Tax=Chengkuizengella axinellae TaxID=3064388 RepID=A0ABT9J339_9BACL|nr:AraC family transcriptional regulator [Chengkuizengella sp. 2205SS18-9]MDP5276041.1 AraC family transcriptional regulator [Chengkuizengella sp. 2205SS18-9]
MIPINESLKKNKPAIIGEPSFLNYKGYTVFSRFTFDRFHRFPKGYFQDEACFIFAEQGAFNLRSPYHLYEVNKSQGVLLKCMDYFLESPSKQHMNSSIELVGVFLYPEMIQEVMKFETIESEFVENFYGSGVPIDNIITNFKESLQYLFDNPRLANELMIKTKLIEFVLLMVYSGQAPNLNEFLSALFKSHTLDFKKTIVANLYSDLSLEEWAHLTGVSLATFKRIFKEIYGSSPMKYLTERKLERSCELLVQTDRSIMDIALESGFNSLGTFNRNFKSHYKLTPSEFRKQKKNERELTI